MKFSIRFAAPIALGLLAAAAPVWAQPDPDNAPKGNNPMNRAIPVRPKGLVVPQIQPRTPEQLKELTKTRLVRELTRLGVKDQPSQDAIVTYILGESEARTALVQQGRNLQQSLRNPAISDTQLAGLLNDYNAAIDNNKARRTKAQAELTKVFDVSKNPKIETSLTIQGLWGDGPAIGNNNLRVATLPGGGTMMTFTNQIGGDQLGDLNVDNMNPFGVFNGAMPIMPRMTIPILPNGQGGFQFGLPPKTAIPADPNAAPATPDANGAAPVQPATAAPIGVKATPV